MNLSLFARLHYDYLCRVVTFLINFQLMGIQEFKDMYSAIEKHHRNLKLAHLTGQAKDVQ